MNISALFINRPVATTLLTIGLALAGAIAFGLLPVSALPPVDYPTIQVSANLPGADPEIMATSVAAPLERQFGESGSHSGGALRQHAGFDAGPRASYGEFAIPGGEGLFVAVWILRIDGILRGRPQPGTDSLFYGAPSGDGVARAG